MFVIVPPKSSRNSFRPEDVVGVTYRCTCGERDVGRKMLIAEKLFGAVDMYLCKYRLACSRL